MGGASGAAGQSTGGTPSSAWQWTTSYSGNPIPAGPPVEFRPPGAFDAWNVPKESGSESFWLRNAYAELADRLRMRLRGDPEADQKIDEALHQINWLRTGEEYVETGHDLRSRWRKWVKEIAVAISNLTEDDLRTTVEMFSTDEEAEDLIVQINALVRLEEDGRVRGATVFRRSNCAPYVRTRTTARRSLRR